MTVASTTNRKTYTGDNVTTSFATSPVIFYATSDLQVRVTVIATGVSTLLTLNTHYSVSGGSAAGATGTVSLAGGSSPHGALLSTEKLVILRVLPLTQTSDFVNNNNSDAEVLEAALDKLTDVGQQIQEQADRGIRFASGDVSGSITEIPDVTTRAGKLLGFDPLGVLTTIAATTGTSLVDLAAAAGSSLIGFIQAGTGAILRTMQAKLRDTVSVKDFGAVGDGVTNDTVALNAAFALTGQSIFLPKGNYLCNSGLNPPVCSEIKGEGAIDTKITFAAGVTKGFSYTTASSNHLTRLSGFSIWGNATAAARGMVLGDGGITSDLAIYDVHVRNWTGAGAIGVDIQDADFYAIYNMVLIGNTQNLHIKGSTLVPTGIDFYSLVSIQATNEGVLIENGNNIRFYGPILETNGKEGIKVAPPVGGNNATEIELYSPRFEGNYGLDTTKYHLVFDASAAASLIRAKVHGGFWNTDGTHAKSIKWTGSGISACSFWDPQVPDLAAQILVDTNISTLDYSLPANLANSATAIVSDASNLGLNLKSPVLAWKAWTPTYSTNIGNAAASFTGTPTTVFARYRLTGKTMTVALQYTATLLAITPSSIRLTLPSGFVPFNSVTYQAVSGFNGAAQEIEYLHSDTAFGLVVSRSGLANWGSGNAVENEFTFTFEIA